MPEQRQRLTKFMQAGPPWEVEASKARDYIYIQADPDSRVYANHSSISLKFKRFADNGKVYYSPTGAKGLKSEREGPKTIFRLRWQSLPHNLGLHKNYLKQGAAGQAARDRAPTAIAKKKFVISL